VAAKVTVPDARPHHRVLSTAQSFSELARHNERLRSASPKILTPAQLRAVYNCSTSSTAGSGKTIAIVDAYNASTVEADLATFSAQFGLPACTTANGCFTKVNQTGGTTWPVNNANWGMEAALDVQTVHSIAPGAKILLVVANSAGLLDLFAAISYAKLHATYITMSFGSPEGSWVYFYDPINFAKSPGISFFASTGDAASAGGVEYPSTSPLVVAVGGTTVYTNPDATLSSEQGWSNSTGGCSAFFNATTAQAANASYPVLGCSGKRAVPDVSMDGDPNSGVYVYNSFGCTPPNCFYQVGGTSLSSPIFAARAAVRGAVVNSTYVYGTAITYRDITVGSNGAYSCRVGLDLVTGLGVWIGA